MFIRTGFTGFDNEGPAVDVPLPYVVSAVLAFAALLLLMIAALSKQRRTAGPSDSLETTLFHWTPHDPFSVRSLLNGGIFIAGIVGSGKTSSSGKLIGTSIVRFTDGKVPKSGGLILAAKPEDLAMWQGIFAAAGRSQDLRVFSPSESLRFSFLDYEMRNGGHTRNITKCILTIGESLRSNDSGGGSDQDPFWRQQSERMIYNAVEIVKHATGKVSAPDLQRFIIGAAQNAEQLTSDAWRASFHCQCLEAAHNATKSPVDSHDVAMATDYWLGEMPLLADRTRSSILASVMGLLHVFNTGIVRELVSTTTNITPDDMFSGQFILVNMSPTEFGDIGSFICAGWKYLTQRRVLRREAKPSDCINVIWADEAQQHVNSFDAQYLAQCRSHLGCMVYIAHGLPDFYAALKGETGKQQTHALLANFTHTILHAVDTETAEWASRKLGKRRETLFGGSSAPTGDICDDLFGQSRLTGSFSEHYENIVQENVFMNGLRTGGKANGLACDAIVIKSGLPFSTGENWIHRTFLQE